jgi:hypothetical protein
MMPGLFDGFTPQSGGLLGNLQRNTPYVAQGAPTNFNTQLQPLDEMAFRQWVQQNNVPFNPNNAMQDYDMRGFYQGLQQQSPRAQSAVNQNDGQMHYPDYWKTPYHQTFSGESQWAGPMAPRWNPQDQLVAPSGRILFDERRR